MATGQEIAAALAALSAAYRREIDKATALTWGRALKDLPGDVLTEAVDAWIKTATLMPVPAQILETARIIQHRRAMRTPALGEHQASVEEQRDINRRGVAMVRAQLAQGKFRVGKHIDDVLAEDGEET